MGVDINIYVIDRITGEKKSKALYEDRNYDMFEELEESDPFNYHRVDQMPKYYGVPVDLSMEALDRAYALKNIDGEEFQATHDNGFYGFRYLTVGEYISWYEEYDPPCRAGYLSPYQRWEWKAYSIPPIDDDVDYRHPDGHRVEFTVWYENYCPYSDIYDELFRLKEDGKITDEDYIVYYFDR